MEETSISPTQYRQNGRPEATWKFDGNTVTVTYDDGASDSLMALQVWDATVIDDQDLLAQADQDVPAGATRTITVELPCGKRLQLDSVSRDTWQRPDIAQHSQGAFHSGGLVRTDECVTTTTTTPPTTTTTEAPPATTTTTAITTTTVEADPPATTTSSVAVPTLPETGASTMVATSAGASILVAGVVLLAISRKLLSGVYGDR